MTAPRHSRGSILVAPLVGAALGLVVLAGLTTTLAQAARWVVHTERRAAVTSAAERLVQALSFDIRQAGWDPSGAGIDRLVLATPAALELHADLDGDGAIDAASAERIRYRHGARRRTLSRLVGNQSMPLANDIDDLAFAYLDADGRALPLPTTGLPTGELDRIRAVQIRVTLRPAVGGIAIRRTVTIALRGSS